MIGNVRKHLQDKVKHRIWLFSDLQQSIPEQAAYCLSTAVDDFKDLQLACDYIWYLGDAVEGSNKDQLQEMIDIQLNLLKPLDIPVRFVLGNHDFDYMWAHRGEAERLPVFFYEAVANTDGWKTIDQLTSFYFTEDIGDYKIVFLSDHGDPFGEWISTHGLIHGNEDKYPFTKEDFLKLRQEIAQSSKKVITVSHGSFAGGNRAFPLWDPLLPLPDNVKVHFYGHSHIGDVVHGKEQAYRKIAYVDHEKTPQINVSSLENRRGDEVRSVILEIYEDDTIGVYFRDHEKKVWADLYMMDDRR
ncbi:metallophosphoesterase [Gracilibacillus alcaliphilus]|uniref:metallophosphoesterase n=1 Tax=Gracilibacillus alcaliphilus TaxID=1401441 RepID=UPI0019596691|nr:metallophosphoesterase [Gracilibacillus alcaliphilus]MBM7676813.1 putative phosphodiesterase [Gracilibacillus alcaliphilus]